jgi:hypothetical protein
MKRQPKFKPHKDYIYYGNEEKTAIIKTEQEDSKFNIIINKKYLEPYLIMKKPEEMHRYSASCSDNLESSSPMEESNEEDIDEDIEDENEVEEEILNQNEVIIKDKKYLQSRLTILGGIIK